MMRGSSSGLVMVMMVVVVAAANKTQDDCFKPNSLPPRKRNICNGMSLLSAAEHGDLHKVEELLESPDRSYVLAYTENNGWRRGFTSLMLAAEHNHTQVVDALVAAGASVNHTSTSKYTVVYLLAENGATESLQNVLSLGANPDVMTNAGLTPVLIGAWNGFTAVVKMLLERRANPNVAKPNTLYTPLYLASKAGDEEMVRALLNAGANIDFQTYWGVTALIGATSWGRQPVVAMLLKARADPNIVEKDGFTALHKAVYYRHPEIVRDLLDYGASVQAQDTYGRTPLHYCVMVKAEERWSGAHKPRLATKLTSQKRAMMQELMERCPDAAITDYTGKTALDLALEVNATQLLPLLKGYKKATCT
ncbi:ankyrin repeat domain-containing protein 29 [Procambarus clarkii]|uniref:ankyrin repeat domain-containing protein 29 n=1 Tax=Procambarus clarkii TaxID=6728 RepID=UPI001E6755A7|nr:ankyrin-3-like [Procambarus clarkii]